MKANPMVLRFAAIAFVTTVGAGAFLACSSDDNPAPSGNTVLEAGPDEDTGTTTSSSSGGSGSGSGSGSSSGASSSSGSSSGSSGAEAGTVACTPDGGAAATCNSCAVTGVTDSYNTCSSFGCAGAYDNTAHGVPSPLPSP